MDTILDKVLSYTSRTVETNIECGFKFRSCHWLVFLIHIWHIQAVIEAGIIGPLVQLLGNAEFGIKQEAARAVSNATFCGSHEQIK